MYSIFTSHLNGRVRITPAFFGIETHASFLLASRLVVRHQEGQLIKEWGFNVFMFTFVIILI